MTQEGRFGAPLSFPAAAREDTRYTRWLTRPACYDRAALMRPTDHSRPMQAAVLAAATLPALLAFNVSPSPTFLNQALAFVAWGLFALSLALAPGLPALRLRDLRPAMPALAALAIVALAAAWSSVAGALPSSLALSAVATIVAASVLLTAGVAASRGAVATTVFAAFCTAWVVAGLLNAGVGAIQVFAPTWPDGEWIARSAIAGRAVGNLRQPNHLSSLLLWSAIALVGLIELQRLGRRTAAALMAVIVFAVVLTASRTGVIGVVLLATWALVDRRLDRGTKRLLLSTPVIYAAGWAFMATWARVVQATFGGQQRLAEPDLSASRFAIWSDTLTLIRDNPWTGVGFGEFNFAWSLSVMPHRPTAFFDHTHNLPLQLAVELGLPLAVAILGLLVLALWRGVLRARAAPDVESLTARCAIAMLVLIGLHSMLEYPLWYAYFLLPAAYALGLAVGRDANAVADDGSGAGRRTVLMMASVAVVVGSLAAVVDYVRVVAIFSSGDGVPSLQTRIERGRSSVLFAHHAAYAQATVAEQPAGELEAFGLAAHYLIDTRLMLGWAQAYAQSGDTARAAYLAQRLREFRNPQSAAFLAECDDKEATVPASQAFQCRLPAPELDWRDFLSR